MSTQALNEGLRNLTRDYHGGPNPLGPKAIEALNIASGQNPDSPNDTAVARGIYDLMVPANFLYNRDKYDLIGRPALLDSVSQAIDKLGLGATHDPKKVTTQARRALRALSSKVESDTWNEKGERVRPLSNTLLGILGKSLSTASENFQLVHDRHTRLDAYPTATGVLFDGTTWVGATPNYSSYLDVAYLQGQTKFQIRDRQGLSIIPYMVEGQQNGSLKLDIPSRVVEIVWAPPIEPTDADFRVNDLIKYSREAATDLVAQLTMTDSRGQSAVLVNRNTGKPVVLDTPEYVVIKTHARIADALGSDILKEWEEAGLISDIQYQVVKGTDMPVLSDRIRSTAISSNARLGSVTNNPPRLGVLERFPDIHVYLIKLNTKPVTEGHLNQVNASQGSGNFEFTRGRILGGGK